MRSLVKRGSKAVVVDEEGQGAPIAPPMVTITPRMKEKAVRELLACEAEKSLTNCYGEAPRRRAEQVIDRVLAAALEVDFND